MAEVEDPETPPAHPGTNRTEPPPRKLLRARRLLVASIGAATFHYAGCTSRGEHTIVSNLLAAPNMPITRRPIVPPAAGQGGAGGRAGAAAAGQGGAAADGGAAGDDAAAPDMDAGLDDDAGLP